MKLRCGYESQKFVIIVTDDDPVSPKILERVSMTVKEMLAVTAVFHHGQPGMVTLHNHEQLVIDKDNGAIDG